MFGMKKSTWYLIERYNSQTREWEREEEWEWYTNSNDAQEKLDAFKSEEPMLKFRISTLDVWK